MKKIVFIDIDGTIVDCSRSLSVPTDKTKEAIDRLKENGHLVFIASGRSKCMLPQEVIDLKPSGYLLANGAYAEIDGKAIFSEILSDESVDKIISFSEENEACYYLETQEHIFTKDMKMQLNIDFMAKWDTVGDYTDQGFKRDLGFNIAMIAIKEDDELFNKTIKELSSYVSLAQHPNSYSFDLNILGTSKGSGIKRVIDKLGISIDDTYAFGDGYNDIEMFEVVKHGIAMANGVKELKEIAYDITLDVLDDGLYYGLKKLSLI